MLHHDNETGADAIINMRHHANETMQRITEVLAYGTGVMVEKEASFKKIYRLGFCIG